MQIGLVTSPYRTAIPAAGRAAQPTAIEPAVSPTVLPRSRGARIASGLLLGTAALGLAGCGQSPTTPPSQTSISTQATYLVMSTAQEVELGKQVAAQVEKKVPLWHNDAAQQRVDRIGKQLATVSTRKDVTYQFKLLDTDTVNAMAIPGGTIYVTRGLYQKFPDDNQLTFVMGHEMTHVEQRHAVKQLEKISILNGIGKWASGNSQLGRDAVQVTEALLSNQISQADESQADRGGQAHLVALGINPWHAVHALQTLQSATKDNESRAITRIFSDHPPTADRIEAMRRGAAGVPQP